MRLVLVLAGLLLCGPAGVTGQHPQDPAPEWVNDAGIAAANVVAAGITAGVVAWIRGEDIGESFLRGAVGGAGVFVGKRIAVERFDGAGLLGRQIAAVGSNVSANGAAGRGWLEELWLPIGPVWLQASPASDHAFRLDVFSTVAMAWAGTRPELEIDWGQTLSNGTAVFVAPRHRIEGALGFAWPGVVVLGASDDPTAVRAHEMVHVIQFDFILRSVDRPLEDWAWGRISTRPAPVHLSLLGSALLGVGYEIVEAEADLLEGR